MSYPHTHQQNRMTEKKHRHIFETRLALAQSSMTVRMWDEAFLTACYLTNHLPSRVINNKTPLPCLFKTPTNYYKLKKLAALANQTSEHTIHASLCFGLNNASSLGTIIYTRGISVFTRRWGEYISLEMLSSMRLFLPFPSNLTIAHSTILTISHPLFFPLSQLNL